MDWLLTAKFQYNDKKYVATGKTPFEIKPWKTPWKGDLMVQTRFHEQKNFKGTTEELETSKMQWKKHRRT